MVGKEEVAALRRRLKPEVETLLLQLELPLEPTQQAARDAHAHGVQAAAGVAGAACMRRLPPS